MSRFFRRIGVTIKKRRLSRASGIVGHNAPQKTLAKLPEAHRRQAAGLHRRDLDQDQHDTALRLVAGASASSTRSRRANGRPRLSWPRCATTASRRPVCSTVPSTASAFAPMSNSSSSRRSSPTTSCLDNLGSHKDKAVRKAVALWRPSPVPAEIFARPQSDRTGLRQDQSFVRKAAPAARGVSDAIGQVLSPNTRPPNAPSLRNAGYA